MKISDIPYGTKILVPCVSCGYKRSIVFQGTASYAKSKLRNCHDCANEGVRDMMVLPNHKKHHAIQIEDMN